MALVQRTYLTHTKMSEHSASQMTKGQKDNIAELGRDCSRPISLIISKSDYAVACKESLKQEHALENEVARLLFEGCFENVVAKHTNAETMPKFWRTARPPASRNLPRLGGGSDQCLEKMKEIL